VVQIRCAFVPCRRMHSPLDGCIASNLLEKPPPAAAARGTFSDPLSPPPFPLPKFLDELQLTDAFRMQHKKASRRKHRARAPLSLGLLIPLRILLHLFEVV
jgi:hypothetical protein